MLLQVVTLAMSIQLIKFHTLKDEVDAIDNVERDKIDPCLLIEFESKPFSTNHFCTKICNKY